MGCVGFTMPLLSTLAALVIIVHSAEENYEREFHMMRPRALDTQTNYDQPWRLVEMEPTVTQSSQITQSEIWDETDPEQLMRTRRRKRKRRPLIAGEDDLVPQERVYTYNEDSLPHLQENKERPRRRRKKIDFQNSDNKERSSWNEEENRPKRRRGHKRKRPLADPMPELSEFGGYREQTDGSEETTDFKEIQIDSIPDEENNNQKEINEKVNSKVQIYTKKEPEIEKTTQPMINYKNQPQVVKNNEDISLSEFSIESIRPNEKPNRTRIDLQEKTKEKGITISNNIDPPKIKPIGTDQTENIVFNVKTIPNEKLEKSLEKIRRLNKRDIKEECYLWTIEDTFIRRDKEPLDPFTLKSLLKKSNGKSLSEILQQNNLSLADLLHGREEALTILKKESLTRTQDMGQSRHSNTAFYSPISSIENIELADNKKNSKLEKDEENEHVEIATTTIITTTENLIFNDNQKNNNGHEEAVKYQENEPVETHRRGYLRRRFPGGIRRKLRTRPTENNTYKGQLSRDLIALSSLKYKNNRNISKSREWKEIVPSMMEVDTANTEAIIQIENEPEIITTTPCPFTETTVQEIYETTTDPSYNMNTEPIVDSRDESETTVNSKSTYLELEGIDIAQFTTSPVDVNTEQEQETITRKSDPLPIMKPLMNSSDMRRQALNNRLKRKRVKQRTSTTEIPEELEVKDTFGIGKFVSASKFITNTQNDTRTTKTADADESDFTTLEDFLTTEATQKGPSRYRFKKPMKTKNATAFTYAKWKVFATTEETAKYEIEEILNDNHTSAKLSKILKERNMTLKELVEHRERGSSHVHLADIFHNASREPNPPEPFLSKSLIEPISKETYPLRALLEANLHDPRTTTIDPTVPLINNANIPVVMDFGNNVNENGENKGVISLFKNYSKPSTDKSNTNKESARVSYDMDDETNSNNQGTVTSREARTLNSEKDSVTWNDLINLMQKNHQKENIDSEKPIKNDRPNSETLKKIDLEEDLDGDGVIVLDDLQQLRNMERKTSSDKLLDFKIHERSNPLLVSNHSYTVLSDTKSVTVATASIIGLALILFLLTYAILKWKQQNKIFHTKHAKEDEFVPTPVFESRKSQKINSSTRSKSPMLATQNIYSIDTIDTHAGSESPEYMWDTLRKPF